MSMLKSQDNSLLKLLKINFLMLLCAAGLSSLALIGPSQGEDFRSVGYLIWMAVANGALVFWNIVLAVAALLRGDRRRAGIYFLGSIIVFLIGLGLCFGPMFVLK